MCPLACLQTVCAGAAQHLPEEPAAVCREHQRKLAQAQAQVGRNWAHRCQSSIACGLQVA